MGLRDKLTRSCGKLHLVDVMGEKVGLKRLTAAQRIAAEGSNAAVGVTLMMMLHDEDGNRLFACEVSAQTAVYHKDDLDDLLSMDSSTFGALLEEANRILEEDLDPESQKKS